MLRSKTFNKLSDLITFMRGQAIPVSAGTAIVQNSTGHYDLLYEDADAADDVVPNARPNAGVSYGEEDAVAVAGTVIEVSSFRTSVTGEAGWSSGPTPRSTGARSTTRLGPSASSTRTRSPRAGR